jgi:hypothetical protein
MWHPCVYNCVTTLCRQQTEVIQSHQNPNVRANEEGETQETQKARNLWQLGKAPFN